MEVTEVKRLTKAEIVKETIQYYKTHARGYDTNFGNCEYLTNKGAKCAVGRCIMPTEIARFQDRNVHMSVRDVDDLDNFIEEKYRGHDTDFWVDLQMLHDDTNHWGKNKRGFNLTERGQKFIENHFVD